MLRVVRESDEVASVVLEKSGVRPMELLRQRVAESRNGLMPIAAVEIDPRPVEEKALLWPKANALYAGYDGYQELAGDRDIPIVICSPQN